MARALWLLNMEWVKNLVQFNMKVIMQCLINSKLHKKSISERTAYEIDEEVERYWMKHVIEAAEIIQSNRRNINWLRSLVEIYETLDEYTNQIFMKQEKYLKKLKMH